MGFARHGHCRRCRRMCTVHWSLGEPEPPHYCERCRIVIGLEQIQEPRWFGAQWWCWLTTRHDDVVRLHDDYWQSRQCKLCGRVHVGENPEVGRQRQLREQRQLMDLAAEADPEYHAAVHELDATTKGDLR